MKIGKLGQPKLVDLSLIASIVIASICATAVLTLPTAAFAQAQGNIANSSAPANSSVGSGPPFVEGKGMVTGQRVIEVSPLPKIETSFFENDTYNGGITASDIGTYTSVVRADGSIYGEGKGIVTSKDGEMATWTGQGIGQFMQDGSIKFHGSLFYDTNSTGKLSFLKNLVSVFYYEVDQTGKTMSKAWEWK